MILWSLDVPKTMNLKQNIIFINSLMDEKLNQGSNVELKIQYLPI